jgi:hypothetical protein
MEPSTSGALEVTGLEETEETAGSWQQAAGRTWKKGGWEKRGTRLPGLYVIRYLTKASGRGGGGLPVEVLTKAEDLLCRSTPVGRQAPSPGRVHTATTIPYLP